MAIVVFMHESMYTPTPPPHPGPGWGFDFDLVLMFANAPHHAEYQRFRMSKNVPCTWGLRPEIKTF